MKYKTGVLGVAVFALTVCGISAAQGTVMLDTTVSQSEATVDVMDIGTGDGDRHIHNFTALPFSGSDGESSGANVDNATYTLSTTNFTIAVTQAREGETFYSEAQSSGSIYFKATDATTSYHITGSYAYSSPDSALSVYLYDFSSGQYLFSTQPTATGGSLGSFDVTTASSSGSLSGLLTPGADYLAFFSFVTSHVEPGPDLGATAAGNVSFFFSDSAVPEPSVLGVIGIWLVASYRRRKNAGSKHA